MAEVERSWFGHVLNGEKSLPPMWGSGEGFTIDTADTGEAFSVWQQECARSGDIVDAAESLEITGNYGDEVFSLRYILVHMIEEYTRHNGHADLIRERLDGTTGE